MTVTPGVAESQPKEAELLDSRYRRDFITCDNQLLNGEMFLQVKTSEEKYYIDFKNISGIEWLPDDFRLQW